MKFSDIKKSIVHQFEAPQGNKTVFFIMGAPGGGKSACAREALADLGFTAENTVEFVASLRDPVDVLGTPNNKDLPYTQWVPPEEFYKLRAGVGRCALLLEELSDASVPMQNALCGVLYDRRAGQLQLSDQLYIIATGNRTEDKSGANRVTTKLAGRTRRLDFTENLDELTEYAIRAKWPVSLISFLRFRENLVSDFDPNRFANPTPRTWDAVARIPTSLPDALFYDNAAGDVGPGAAAEYTGFLRIYKELPVTQDILTNPTTALVPTDLAAKYAVMGAVAHATTKSNIANVVKYLDRFPPEFGITAMKDITKLQPDVRTTTTFTAWAVKHSNLFT